MFIVTMAGTGITFARSITLEPATQSVVTVTPSPAGSSQHSGGNSGEGVAIWVAISVAVLVVVNSRVAGRRKPNKQ
jgi:hypothetical protein